MSSQSVNECQVSLQNLVLKNSIIDPKVRTFLTEKDELITRDIDPKVWISRREREQIKN